MEFEHKMNEKSLLDLFTHRIWRDIFLPIFGILPISSGNACQPLQQRAYQANVSPQSSNNNQWPLMFDASLDGRRTSEKWPLLDTSLIFFEQD